MYSSSNLLGTSPIRAALRIRKVALFLCNTQWLLTMCAMSYEYVPVGLDYVRDGLDCVRDGLDYVRDGF